jgi:hypothetical protein
MDQVKMNNVLSAINTNPGLSGTAIAQIVGFTKSSSIREELKELIRLKKICEESNGRFPVYKINEKNQSISQSTDKKVSTISLPKKENKEELPEVDKNIIQGYKLENIIFRGEKMKKIVCPNNKAIRIKDEERLLVINGEPKFVIETADQVLTCIKKYSQDNGLTVFTVNDICQNKKIGTENDVEIKDKHILFLTIKKHNKAALKNQIIRLFVS